MVSDLIKHFFKLSKVFPLRPTLSDDDTLIIHNVLEDKLMRVVEKKVIVPWKDIKDVPRIERKQFRKKHLEVVLNNDEGIK